MPTITTCAEHLLRDRVLGEALCDGLFGYNARDYLSFKLLLDIVLRRGWLTHQIAEIGLATQSLHLQIRVSDFAGALTAFE